MINSVIQPVLIVDVNGNPIASSAGGGGGGAVTIADGANVAQGAVGDAAVTNPALSASEIALLKGLLTELLSIDAGIPAALGAGGGLKVDGSGTALPISGTVTASGTLGIDQTTPGTTDSVTVKASSGIGSLTESAPASDTASSGLNGRLQRIAQNITTLIASVLKVVGNVATGAAVSGSPVYIAGIDTSGNIRPPLMHTTGVATITRGGSGADGSTNTLGYILDETGAQREVPVTLNVFNGSTFDRQRGITALTLLASAARTVTTNSSDQVNYNWRGALLIVDVSNAGTGSITPSIQIKDSISGNYKTIWTAAAALTVNGTYVYPIYPGSLGAASYTEVVNALFSRTWRLQMVHNNANSITYSASGDMQL